MNIKVIFLFELARNVIGSSRACLAEAATRGSGSCVGRTELCSTVWRPVNSTQLRLAYVGPGAYGVGRGG